MTAATSPRGTVGRSAARGVIGLAIGAVCLWLALRGVDRGELVRVARDANPSWIVLATVLLLVSYSARARRWGVILGVSDLSRFAVLYWSTGLGYFLNSVLPARAGDVARSAAAARDLRTSTARVLASTVVERVVDAATLALALAVAIPFLPALPEWLGATVRIVGIVSLVLVVTLVLAVRHLRSQPRASELADSSLVRRTLSSFGAGLMLIDTVGRGSRVLTATAVVWAIDVCLTLSLARAFGVSLSALEALALLAAFGLASAAPSTPGFVGVFQAIAVGVLVPFGASPAAAIAIATALQVVTLCSSLVATLLGAFAVRRISARQPGTIVDRSATLVGVAGDDVPIR